MTTQATAHSARAARQRVRVQVAMTAFTLAVLGTFVLWQVWPKGDQAATPVSVSTNQDSVTPSRASEGVTPRGGLAELYAYQEAQTEAAIHTVYIVESEERAQLLRTSLDQENAMRAIQGQPPLGQQVLAFESAEEATRFEGAVEWLRSVPGNVPMMVVDLRAAPAMTTAPCAPDIYVDPSEC